MIVKCIWTFTEQLTKILTDGGEARKGSRGKESWGISIVSDKLRIVVCNEWPGNQIRPIIQSQTRESTRDFVAVHPAGKYMTAGVTL
jgi:hypothetical protein